MIKDWGTFAYDLGDEIQNIVEEAIDGYTPYGGLSAHEYEDEITGDILGGIRNNLDPDTDEFRIVPDTYNGPLEDDVGADFAVLYDVNTDELDLQTGIFVQAKRFESSHYNDWEHLISQCENMLSYSTDSYVIDYSNKDDPVNMVPAVSIAGTDKSELENDTWLPEMYHKRQPGEVFKLFFLGFLGSEYAYRAVSESESAISDLRRVDDLNQPDPIYADGGEQDPDDRTIKILKFTVKSKEE